MPRVKLFDESEVLTKAMHLFWKQGYAATSIQDLVNHLGINRASIYDTYGDKEKLFLKAFEHYRQTNTEIIAQFFKGEKDVKKGFRELFERAIDEAVCDGDKKGCFVVNTTTELIPGDPKVLKLLEENEKTFKQLFYEYLQQGEADGQFEAGKDLKSVAALLFTFHNGLRVVSKVGSNKKELMGTVEVVLGVLD